MKCTSEKSGSNESNERANGGVHNVLATYQRSKRTLVLRAKSIQDDLNNH